MASGNMKDIKRRIKSVESTMQITKAMELVASSKLRRAKQRAESARPYFEGLYSVMCEIASEVPSLETIYTRKRNVKNRLFVVIAGDRGLAGGYNSNVIKMAVSAHEGDANKPKIIAIGKKSVEYFTKHNYEVAAAYSGLAEVIKPSDSTDIARTAINLFKSGAVDEVQLFFTSFTSVLLQSASQLQVLPIECQAETGVRALTSYDPSPETVFNMIVPKYISGLILGAVVESYASEQGARRTAMESASDNAAEMIESYTLLYNRARQASITQEITEIVSGAGI